MKEVKVKVVAEGTAKASKDIGKVTKSTDKLKTAAKNTSKGMSGMAGNLTKGFGALRTAILNAVPALNAFKLSLISTGVGAIVVAMGSLITLFVKATNIGNKFAKEISTLGAITSKTNEELSGLSNQAKALGASTQFTAIEVVRLQTELAKLGFTIGDIKNATPAILDLAASLEIGLASAAELAGSVVRSFGLSTEDTKKVVDTLAKSTSISALNFEALRESLKMVAPTARATGVSLEETTALLAVLADNGLKGGVAGTGLAKTFIELSKKGITLDEAIDKVNNSSNGLNTALDLVGINGSKALNTLASNADKLKPLTEQLDKADDAARRLAERRLDNAAGDVTKLGSAWDGFMLSLEDGSGVFSKMYRGIIQATTAFITGLQMQIEFGGAAIRNFLAFFPKAFDASKEVLTGGFGTILSKIKIFSSKAILAFADIPIIGAAIDKEAVTENLIAAEEALADSQERMLKGIKGFGEAADTLSRTGILKTMVTLREEQAETTKLRTGADITEGEGTDPESTELTPAQLAEQERIKKYTAWKNSFDKQQADYEAETAEEKLKLEEERAIAALEALRPGEDDLAAQKEFEQQMLDLKTFYAEKERDLVLKTEAEKKAAKDALLEEFKVEEEEKSLEEEIAANEKAMADTLKELEEYELTEAEKLRITEFYEQKKADIIKKFNDQTNKDKLDKMNQGFDMVRKGLQATQSLTEGIFSITEALGKQDEKSKEKRAKKAFMVDKALKLSQAGMGVAQGMINAFSQTTDATPTQSLRTANGIMAGVVGLANMAKIASAKFDSNMNSDVSRMEDGGGSQDNAAPSFNLVQGTSDNALQNSIDNRNAQPIKAYVVSGDVTNAQALDREISDSSSI